MINVRMTYVVDHLFVLFLNLVAKLDDGMHHPTPPLRHVLTEVVQLLLKRRYVTLDVGGKTGELVADGADQLR
jgi:hypothetical protein